MIELSQSLFDFLWVLCCYLLLYLRLFCHFISSLTYLLRVLQHYLLYLSFSSILVVVTLFVSHMLFNAMIQAIHYTNNQDDSNAKPETNHLLSSYGSSKTCVLTRGCRHFVRHIRRFHFSLAHKSKNVYNLRDFLMRNHDVRT